MSFPSPAQGSADEQQVESDANVNLHNLLASFRRHPAAESAAQPQDSDPIRLSHLSHQPDYPPTAPTPPVFGHASSQYPPGMLKTTTTAHDSSDLGRSATLLSLLRHNSQKPANTNQYKAREASSFPPVIHAPAPTAADPSGLLAALMRDCPAHSDKQEQAQEQGLKRESEPESAPALGSRSTWNQGPLSDRTQDYLLSLLHRPKPASEMGKHEYKAPSESPCVVASTSNSTVFPSVPSQVYFDYQVEGANAYPLEAPLEGSSSALVANPAPKSSTTSASQAAQSQTAGIPGPSALPVQILKKSDLSNKRSFSERSWSANNFTSPDHTRQKTEHTISPLSHTSNRYPLSSAHDSPKSHKESVAEAMSHLAGKAETEAQEAMVRAEQDLSRAQEEEQTEVADEIAHDLEKVMTAQSDQEFMQSAQLAASAIQKELAKEDNQSALENKVGADVAQAVKHIIDETAQASQPQGIVADSWESADADDMVVSEEDSSPVKVHNLPMKPWISISIQPLEERATFPDDGILDIARLKKEFDQVDRNLVSSTEVHLTYGMSKAGGFRVIRQEDGKDARLFTDTQDRIFHVAMSVSAPGLSPKESALCTGVSGTVYWVELTNGDRSHLDDSHPEQYGFALPPMTVHEGDAPGGVLKTRARMSTAHPEFFAVGRGKWIQIVWPHFVFRHNLFKSGHDRIVDTEELLRQCSLKINTAKAGKDFIFSQDDTMVVSLDKAGRVKFWDVRELTAVDDSSDSARPLPAHASLEIKEPLMVLTTSPEGEKSRPTSVLLLDKYRPYQRGAALRYMIVGMKQNHTLQLWDLVLGKAVQEINFPHSHESDGVCSIAYHAPSSMLVVGHPTRNSIYFLHLSAPKYNFKTLSQVEFVQRLHAKDASIASPDVTAVISGIREFSLAPKGLLRSCSILENPAAQGSGGEPVLFELYAMHSKGVTAFCVKQAELGWTQDNKVISPVDAVASGMVKVAKLAASGADQLESHPAAQVRIATRNHRDLLHKAPSSQGEKPRSTDLPTSVRLAQRPKEKEAAALETRLPAYTAGEKAEKRNHKKKGAAAAAAASAAAAVAVAGAGTGPGAGGPEFAAGSSSLSAVGLVALGGTSKRDVSTTNAEVTPTTCATPTATAPTKSNCRPDKVENFPPTTSTKSSLALMHDAETERLLTQQVDIMAAQVLGGVGTQLDTLLQAIKGKLHELLEQRDQQRDQEFAVHQATLLDTVSKVLTNNTDDALAKIVRAQFEQTVLPSISDQLAQMTTSLGGRVTQSLQHQVQDAMPAAVNQALQQADMVRPCSNRIASSEIMAHLDAQTSKAVHSAIGRVLPTALSKMSSELLAQMDEKLVQQQRSIDAKIDPWVVQMTDLAGLVNTVAATQAQVQQDLCFLSRLIQQSPSTSHSTAVSAAAAHHHHHVNAPAMHAPILAPLSDPMPMHMPNNQAMSPDDPFHVHGTPYSHHHNYHHHHHHQNQDRQLVRQPMQPEQRVRMTLEQLVAKVTSLMKDGNYEQAAITWITAGNEHTEEIFKAAIVPFGTAFLPELSPLLMLTVAQLLTRRLDTQADLDNGDSHVLRSKLSMVDVLIHHFEVQLSNLDSQILQVAPDVMTDIHATIEQVFMHLSAVAPNDAYLTTLNEMAHSAKHIIAYAREQTGNYGSA